MCQVTLSAQSCQPAPVKNAEREPSSCPGLAERVGSAELLVSTGPFFYSSCVFTAGSTWGLLLAPPDSHQEATVRTVMMADRPHWMRFPMVSSVDRGLGTGL